MGREIVYSETRSGVFEPVLTRAQKRQAKREQEARAKKIEGVWGIALLVFIVISYATIFAVDIFAPWIWPIAKP